MFWYDFVLCELGVRLKRMLFLELLFLCLPCHLLLFVLHQVALMHEEVRRIHDLFIIHVLLLEAHLSRNLPFPFVGEVCRVRCNLRLEAQFTLLLLLLNALLELELPLVELQSVQIVHIEQTLQFLYLGCSDAELAAVVLETNLAKVRHFFSCGALMLAAVAFQVASWTAIYVAHF